MRHFLGWRKMFGVPTPWVNTCVQPEYDAMCPPGVTNHISRMHVPDMKVSSDTDFEMAVTALFDALGPAIDRVVTCRPDHLVLGISALAIWGSSLASSRKLAADMVKRTGHDIGVSLAGDAVLEALARYGVKKKIAIVEPYYPVIQPRMTSFFSEAGFDIVRFNHMQGPQFTEYTRVSAMWKPLVQFGANLPLAGLADEAEHWLGNPVISVNIATYWHALRHSGIDDKVQGWTRLLSEF
jgi:maleate isomerase